MATRKPNKTRKKINLAVCFMGHKISMSRGLKAKTTEQFNLAVWSKFVTQPRNLAGIRGLFAWGKFLDATTHLRRFWFYIGENLQNKCKFAKDKMQ